MDDTTLSKLRDIEASEHHQVGMPDFLMDLLLNDASCMVRHEAAFAIGVIQKKGKVQSDRSIKAALTLMEAVREDSSAIVQHEALQALGEFYAKEVSDFLAEVVNDLGGFMPDLRETAQVSIARIFQKD